ncbi:PrsW family intramembrane metalloprotease [Chryseolinea soli]|uniref:PrsW family intramembrane metalloprotease n=1 Tax=Chryseolinea soli TaxID=2321403 RepID=A0A385SM03_9BACT|nr:PrsW family intramembrane metalloprotease [Chryseolinea soli]AYB30460.1 PrsW family intramembrane metalloprotease [Chryseolinea soli]
MVYFLILLIGGAYLGWRFNALSNKKIFFRSPLFLALMSSVTLLVCAAAIVNVFFKDPPTEVSLADDVVARSTLGDTTWLGLVQQSPEFHYRRIHYLSRDGKDLDALQKKYEQLSQSRDSVASAIGHFGLGAIYLKKEDREKATFHLYRIQRDDFPYVHFCRGVLYMDGGEPRLAEEQFERELHIKGGNFSGAFSYLLKQYEEHKNFSMLKELLKYDPSPELFPDGLRRRLHWETGDFAAYVTSLLQSIGHMVNAPGFVAALLISAMWLSYIGYLRVFRQRNDLLIMLCLFCGGMISTLAVLSFSDFRELYFPWEMDNTFWNDLLYTVFMIGVPEELVKFFPFLLFMMLTPRLKEPIDFIVYASASALGFAFVENVLYFQNLSAGIIHGRAYLSVIGHMIAASIVVYGFVVSRFQLKHISAWISVPVSFMIGAAVHGLYDFLLMHDHYILFVVYFIFMVQVWIIILNNCLNNSPFFTYGKVNLLEKSKYVALGLTFIFAFEYVLVAFMRGPEKANYEFYSSLPFAAMSIIFFASNLSSFNVVRGYWRDIYFSSREKRGYGTLQRGTLLTSWYFVNSIRAHNYVGLKINLSNDPYNHRLAEILDGEYEGDIVSRIVLKDHDDLDPNWFVVKFSRQLPFEGHHPHYALVKLRNQNDSLLYEDDVQIFFKSISDLNQLKSNFPRKEQFPFHGWAYMALHAT